MATIDMKMKYAFDVGSPVRIVEGEGFPRGGYPQYGGYVGREGKITRIRDEQGAPGGVGESPGDPFVIVKFDDDTQDGFWLEEIELLDTGSVGDGECEPGAQAHGVQTPRPQDLRKVPCCSECRRTVPSGLDVQRSTERRALGWDPRTRDLEMVAVEVVWVVCECGEKIYVT